MVHCNVKPTIPPFLHCITQIRKPGAQHCLQVCYDMVISPHCCRLVYLLFGFIFAFVSCISSSNYGDQPTKNRGVAEVRFWTSSPVALSRTCTSIFGFGLVIFDFLLYYDLNMAEVVLFVKNIHMTMYCKKWLSRSRPPDGRGGVSQAAQCRSPADCSLSGSWVAKIAVDKIEPFCATTFSLQKYKIHLSVHSRALIVGGDRAMSKMQGSTIRPAIHINREVYF